MKFGQKVKDEGYLSAGRLGREKRSNILFSDESWIELQSTSMRRNQRYHTEKRIDVPPVEQPKFNQKFMVAGGFCASGTTELHVFEKVQNKIKFDAKYYR
jgi:hypothetical protein